MFEKDYIMRQVQQLIQALSVVLGLKEEKKYDEALMQIENSYERFFEENSKTLKSKNVEDLIRLCSRNNQFSPDLAFALADLIREEAEIEELADEDEDLKKKYQLALGLYEHGLSEKEAAMPIDVMQKIEGLRKKIKEGS